MNSKVLRAVCLVMLLCLAVLFQGASDDGSGTVCFILLLALALYVGPIIYVLRDCSKRGASSGTWGCIVFLFGILGLLVYLVARPQGKLVICPNCNREKPIRDAICPHCGQRVVWQERKRDFTWVVTLLSVDRAHVGSRIQHKTGKGGKCPMKKTTLIHLLILVAVLALPALACGSDNTGQKIEEDEVAPTASSKVEAYKVGEAIQVKDHTIILNEVTVRGKRLKANFTVENKGDDEIVISSIMSFSARDAEGTKLKQEIFDCSSSSLDGKLLAGDKIKGDICWEGLSTDSAKIYYEASLLGSGAVVWEVADLALSAGRQPTITPESPTNTPEVTAILEASATLEPQLELGDTDELEGYSLTAMSVEDPAKPGRLYDPVEGKKLIAVDVVIANVSGDKPADTNPLGATLVDTEGFVYDAELGGVDGQLDMVDLNPGERIRGWIAFEVPEEAVAASIRYEISGYPEILLQTGLGPRSDGQTEIAVPIMAERPQYPPLAETVEEEGYLLSAVAVEDPATPGSMYTSKEGKKLIAVEVVLGNVDGEQFSSNALYATLIDTEGFSYRPELGGREGGQIDLMDLNPGEKVKGWITFEVPEKMVPESIKYEFSGYPKIVLQTGLAQ